MFIGKRPLGASVCVLFELAPFNVRILNGDLAAVTAGERQRLPGL